MAIEFCQINEEHGCMRCASAVHINIWSQEKQYVLEYSSCFLTFSIILLMPSLINFEFNQWFIH
jgi:hypothetical protein